MSPLHVIPGLPVDIYNGEDGTRRCAVPGSLQFVRQFDAGSEIAPALRLVTIVGRIRMFALKADLEWLVRATGRPDILDALRHRGNPIPARQPRVQELGRMIALPEPERAPAIKEWEEKHEAWEARRARLKGVVELFRAPLEDVEPLGVMRTNVSHIFAVFLRASGHDWRLMARLHKMVPAQPGPAGIDTQLNVVVDDINEAVDDVVDAWLSSVPWLFQPAAAAAASKERWLRAKAAARTRTAHLGHP